MSAAPLLDDDPTQSRSRSAELSPYAVVLRSSRRPSDASVIATELIESHAARLGVALRFDDLGYEAEFSIAAEDELNAVSTARRRWFYLATDIELPAWPITDVNVTPQ